MLTSRQKTPIHYPLLNPLMIYALVVFFVAFGDALMSYVAPIYIQNGLQNTVLMGFVLSFSSFVGLIADFVFCRKFSHKSYNFFIRGSIYIAFVFPLILLFFPARLIPLLIAMAVWGIYYELRGFASFNFIHKFVSFDKHASAWAILEIFVCTAYLFGPIIAGLFVDESIRYVFFAAIVSFSIAALIYQLFTKLFRKRIISQKIADSDSSEKTSKLEFKIIFTLIRRIWPLLLFSTVLSIIDSAFWVVGILFTEQLKKVNPLGHLFMVAYMAPYVLTGFIVPRVQNIMGKKRMAFILAFVSGLCLLFIGLVTNVPLLLILVLLTSIFYDVALVLSLAVYEDYIARLKKYGNDMVTISQFSGNVAYIIGPIVLGLVASFIGNQKTFSFVGIAVISVALACLVVVPRKIKMPHQELESLS